MMQAAPRLLRRGSKASPSASLALCILLLQNIPQHTAGHLRHRHRHDHNHNDNDRHHHHQHRHLDGNLDEFDQEDLLSISDIPQPDGSGKYADVFDSCFVACYQDIVDRYGVEFADQMKKDGFTYEECPEDDAIAIAIAIAHDNATDRALAEHTNNSTQQHALHRILGATNQLHRLWSKPSYRAPNGKLHIPYKIKNTPHFTPETLTTISRAMEHIEQSTGVLKFIPLKDFHMIQNTTATVVEYMYFTHEDHYSQVCAANLGKQMGRPTNLYLGWCRFERHLGNVVHEMLHALGFWHEHSRPDRDDHVTIAWDNLQQKALNNFKKATMVNSLGSPYDFNSIMHYPPVAFSTNRKATIVPVTPLEQWETMGQRAKLSEADVEQLRLLYQCASGPRIGGHIPIDDLCSVDCPCWENAMGSCTSNDECMGDLICGPTPNPYPTPRYVDLLPYYPHTSGQFSCDEWCHPRCCSDYANSKVRCPETCESKPPVERKLEGELPERMCIKDDESGGAAAGGETGSTPSPTDDSLETTTPPSSSPTQSPSHGPTVPSDPWYADWDRDKCVQYCNGPPPCGGLTIPDERPVFYKSAEKCCNTKIWYKSFDECVYTTGSAGGSGETEAPSVSPTRDVLSSSPTASPSSSPSRLPTSTPSLSPTAQPSEVPSASPTRHPSLSPEVAGAARPGARSGSGSTETSSTKTSTLDYIWYADLDREKCVAYCLGDPPCGGLDHDAQFFQTSQRCCATQLGHLDFDECVYDGAEGAASTTVATSSTSSTTITTEKTIEASGEWYIDYDIRKCVRDCTGERPCSYRRKDKWETGYSNVQRCCNSMSYIPFNECSTEPKMETRGGGPDTETSWYPGPTKCLNGNTAPWQQNKYHSHATCCSSHFRWDYDNCMGTTPAATGNWYISWAIGKCVKDCDRSEGGSCGGLLPGSWISTHNSAEMCCMSHMSFATLSECKLTR